MTPKKRKAFVGGTLAAVLIVVAAWNVRWMTRQRAQARHAAADLAACEKLAGRIRALRRKPMAARTADLSVMELGKRIEAASRHATLEGPWLEGVYPQSARRLGDSPYMLKPTVLALRGVTLVQLATFLYHLTGDAGLRVRDLRARTPHGDVPDEVWNAEATVTYVVYAPITKTGRER
jgi:hypothetical protein